MAEKDSGRHRTLMMGLCRKNQQVIIPHSSRNDQVTQNAMYNTPTLSYLGGIGGTVYTVIVAMDSMTARCNGSGWVARRRTRPGMRPGKEQDFISYRIVKA